MIFTKKFFFIFTLTLVTLMAACSHDQTHTLAPIEPAAKPMTVTQNQTIIPDHSDTKPPYRIGPEDVLNISVFGEDDLSGRYRLDGAGNIAMPLIGQVNLNNLTPALAQEHVSLLLSDGFLINPDVNITLEQKQPFYILGEVNKPGAYDYNSTLTILRAVALAGGFTSRANQKEMELIRQNKDGEDNVFFVERTEAIFPGDIITIKERVF